MDGDTEEVCHVAHSEVEAYLDLARYNEATDLQELEALISRSPERVDLQDEQGRTAIHMAAANGHMDVLEMLLQFAPTVDLPNHEGNTALHFAALNNRVNAARRLVQAGWRVSTRNNSGKTALSLIVDKQFEEMEALLLSNDDELDTMHYQGATVTIGADVGEAGEAGDEAPPASQRHAAPSVDSTAPDLPEVATTVAAQTAMTTPNDRVSDPAALLGCSNVDGVE